MFTRSNQLSDSGRYTIVFREKMKKMSRKEECKRERQRTNTYKHIQSRAHKLQTRTLAHKNNKHQQMHTQKNKPTHIFRQRHTYNQRH